MGLVITLFLGLFIIVGAGISKLAGGGRLIEQLSISIAFGTMSALAVTELVPEAREHLDTGNKLVLPICILAGIVILKLLDRLIPEHDHAHGFDHHCTTENVIHIGIISSIAVILHNVIEGMAVYSISAESLKVGLLVALGVGLHNIPMGMVIYSTLEKERRSVKRGIIAATSLSTFAGGIVMALLWHYVNDEVIGALIGLTLGMILYIVLFELLPHLMHSKSKGMSLAGTALGIAIILASNLIG